MCTIRGKFFMHGYYFLIKRKLKSGHMYYYKSYNLDGTLSSARSTGCRNKAAAKIYCDTLLKEGRINSGSNCTFGQYANHFFDDNSVWIQDRKALGTPEHPAISELYIKKLKGELNNYLLPYFADKKFSYITPTEVKRFRLYLLETTTLAYKSINSILSTLRIISDSAMGDNILIASPLRGIKPLMSNSGPRDAFTMKDAKAILNADWKDNETARMFSFVAACTGMRLSEINAIRRENLKPTYIDLKDQLLRGKLSPLKTKESRRIPICEELFEILNDRITDKYAFEIGQNIGSKCLSKVLDRIMPDKKKEHGYSFHSWRHFYNTYLLSENISPVKVAAVLGHSTGVTSVQEVYINFTEENYTEIYAAQKKLFYELKYW